MEFLFSLPAFTKVIITFALILTLDRMGLQLGAAILLCALGLHVWAGGNWETVQELVRSTLSRETLLLVLLIFLLLFFTELLNLSGRINKTVTALKHRMNNPGLLAAGFPALLGLLPMPGGALVSAPLVAQVDAEHVVAAERKVALNYWFRHIWEYWWPMYPGVILALKYSQLPIATFIAVQLPMTAAAIVGGTLFIGRRMGIGKDVGNEEYSSIRDVFSALWPIGLLVVLSVAGSNLFATHGIATTATTLIAMTVSLLVCIGLVAVFNGSAVKGFIPFVQKGKTWSLLLLVLAVQLFSQVLKTNVGADDTSITSAMGGELVAFGIPLLAVIMVMPFIAGLIMGIAIGFVGVSFPLVFGLLGDAVPLHIRIPVTVLAFGFGYMGMMISPIHICLVVTGEYFKSPVIKSYRYLLGPVALVLACTMVSAGLYYWLLK